MSEAAFSKSIVKTFKTYHRVVIQRFEDKFSLGIPDLMVTYKSKTYWLELKVVKLNVRWMDGEHGTKKVSVKFQPQQIPWLLAMRNAGGLSFVVIKDLTTGTCFIVEPKIDYTYSDFDAIGSTTQLQVLNLLKGDYDEL